MEDWEGRKEGDEINRTKAIFGKKQPVSFASVKGSSCIIPTNTVGSQIFMQLVPGRLVKGGWWVVVVVGRSRAQCIVFGYSPVHSLLFLVPAAGYPLASSIRANKGESKEGEEGRTETTSSLFSLYLSLFLFTMKFRSSFFIPLILPERKRKRERELYIFAFTDIGSNFRILKAVLS